MYLKSLTLKGFKSFSEGTTLDLEPGVTAVVGPNGSGKSNIVDAVAWVLGAQGPRTVRSQKMEDVIFAGTSQRPALGRAEVSLTIDNSSRLLPIDFTEVTLTRTLWRSGESEYAINGAPCRLLDVTELLSDAGVGRSQHVIVGQGQIDTVLNARPEDRRLIIEEAAGVLKYRRRREKAERRLEATVVNLERVQDMLREVRRQVAPLERQAAAAKAHDALAAELAAIRLFMAGRRIAGLQARGSAGQAETERLRSEESALLATLRRVEAESEVAERLASREAAAAEGRMIGALEVLMARARGVQKLVTERRRAVAQQAAAALDEQVVSTLEAEAARIAEELAGLAGEDGELEPLRAELAGRAAEATHVGEELAGCEADPARSAEVELARARAELASLQSGCTRDRELAEQLAGQLAETAARLALSEAEEAHRRQENEELGSRITGLALTLAEADAAAAAARAALQAAQDVERLLAKEHQSWAARAELLTEQVATAEASSGRAHLAGEVGVQGVLGDLVDVQEGYERAWQAAAGAAASAVVVDDHDRALAALERAERHGAGVEILAAQAPAGTPLAGQAPTGAPVAAQAPAGATPLTTAAAQAPAGTTPLTTAVRGRTTAADHLVGRLLGAVAFCDGGWREAARAARANPSWIVVTAVGDRFGPAGWRLAGERARDPAAERDEALAQAARLEAEVAEAERAAAAAASRHGACTAALSEREAALQAARSEQAVVAHALGLAATSVEHLRKELAAERSRHDSIETRGAADLARIEALSGEVPVLETRAADAERRAAEASRLRETLAGMREETGALERTLAVRAAALTERRALLEKRSAEVERRLSGRQDERDEARARREELERALRALDALGAGVDSVIITGDRHLDVLRVAEAEALEAARKGALELDALRSARVASEHELSVLRERMQRGEIEATEVRVRLDAAIEALRSELGEEPSVALAAECPPLAEGVSTEGRARDLERELRLMGPVNPLAVEELAAVQERRAFLESQLDDVRKARKELHGLIREIDEEITRAFAGAYEDVARHYEELVSILFSGGTGRLVLTDPDSVLETGIEIEASPPGRTVRKLSLLSGGERSLVALAFLFAVFRARPSPFYIMDEVEAALDDVNLGRFLDLLGEFRSSAQIVIVTHQKRTMEVADALYGVSMQRGGTTKVVSERFAERRAS